MGKIDVGEAITITATFEKDGEITDPTTPVTFAIRSRSGDVTTGTATKVSTGVFEASFTPSESGTHNYTFFSDDNGIAQGTFNAETVIAKAP